jgi:DNA polymerase-4
MKRDKRHIVHVDMDAFFVSVERLLEPSLAGKPVIVGGNPNGRGVVASASYEARAFGIHSAMPLAQARRLCPQALFIEGRYGAYCDYSEKLRTIFESYSPLVEMCSLDEAYIDLTGTERLHGEALRAAEALHKRVARETGLPCSLGLASNRLVAKVASDLAKPNGLLAVPAGAERAFLAPLALRRLPGIGPHTAERLQLYGLRTIGDIPLLGKHALEHLFGSYGSALYESALGADDSLVAPYAEQKSPAPRRGASLGREHTFDEDTCDPAQILATLSYLSEKVAGELRELGARAKTITLKLRYSDFKTITRSLTLGDPTDDECELFRVGKMLFERSYTRRVRIRLIGIGASNLSSAGWPACAGWQIDLLENARLVRRARLFASVDALRRRYGFRCILHGNSFCYLSRNDSLAQSATSLPSSPSC